MIWIERYQPVATAERQGTPEISKYDFKKFLKKGCLTAEYADYGT
jgi:hypothetical protein